ncbi:hypothetical protein IU402_00500 [Aerococcaceae bacterium zg-BR9]|nr:hypothetical protein [Aerococcaceae bacterium zg-BR9]
MVFKNHILPYFQNMKIDKKHIGI